MLSADLDTEVRNQAEENPITPDTCFPFFTLPVGNWNQAEENPITPDTNTERLD